MTTNTKTSFQLGKSDSVPAVGFGTYQLSDDEAEKCVGIALKTGYTHIDTASGYRNESGVGRALKSSGLPRDTYFVTTKLWPGNPKWNMPLLDFDSTIKSCKNSLENLQLEYVDLYLIHAPFAFSASIEAGLEQWKALLSLKEQGLCKNVGVANFNIDHLKAIEKANLELPCCNQLELNPVCHQQDLVSFMKSKSITAIAYSSLAPMRTWRVKSDGSKHESGKTFQIGEAFDEVLKTFASRFRKSEAQVLLAYALHKGYAVLPKSATISRIEENFNLGDIILTADDITSLESFRGEADIFFAWPSGSPTKEEIPQ
eukprot:g8920.t1